MKIWKGLLVAVLLLGALLCVTSITATADNTHSHPICGATHTDIGDHTGSCAAVVWTAWDGTSDIDYGENNVAYVYLSDNATRSGTLTVTDGNTLYLCLNGKTLTGSITVKGDATLNICDCQGSGEVTRTSGNTLYVQTINDSNVHTTLNLYGGKISSDSTFNSGAIELYNNNLNNAQTVAVFNMYGGEVYNGRTGEAAVFANYANIGRGYYELNMYGGSIRCEKGNGFDFSDNENVTMQITGGTITSGYYGVKLISNDKLTLSGNPQFIDKKYYSSGAGICITNGVTLTVTDDFAPAGGTTVSVKKFMDGTTSTAVIATSASGKSLSDKAQYFTSAVEGCFVECNADGNLYLTECAITEQPTKDNRYTVSANGTPNYQWWSTKRGDISVTDERATADTFYYSERREEWYYSTEASDGTAVTLKAFTLHMAAGDVLKLNNVRDIDSSYFHLTGVSITHSGGSSTPLTGTYDDDTFTAPADGEYTVEITAEWAVGSSSYYMNFSFTATVSDDVTDAELSGQTDKTLDTTALENGKYICAVTWGNTTLYSDVAEVHNHTWNDGEVTTAPTCTVAGVRTRTCTTCNETKTEPVDALGHDFAGGTWQSDESQHWKKCSRCDVTNTKYDHAWNDGDVTTPPTCTAAGVRTRTCTECSATKEEPEAALGHDYLTDDTWKYNGEQHWKECYRCQEKKDVADHSGGAATCTEQAKCETCGQSYGNTLGHDFAGGAWQSDESQHWKKCSRCDATDTKSDHAWNDGDVTTPPTCTTAGRKVYTCTDCFATKAETLNANGHHLTHHESRVATCTVFGWNAYDTCSRCSYSTYAELPALGHDKISHEAKAPTCTVKGYDTYDTCSRCDYTTYIELPALGHDKVHHNAKAVTCTESGWEAYETCSRCEYSTLVELPALGHDFSGNTWQSDADNHWKKCSRCDAIVEKAQHTGGTATCKDSAVCAVCSLAYGEPNPENHVGGEEIRDMIASTTEKTGHTGNRYCKGCQTKLSGGTVIPVISDLSIDKKDNLTTAVDAMEKNLNDWDGIYTKDQKELLVDGIRSIRSALESIEKAEEAVKKVEAMPAADTIRPDDKTAMDAFEVAKKSYDALTADEKRMTGEATKDALDAMWKVLTAYDVIDGDGSSWTENDANNGLTFTVNGYHEKFAGIVINGAEVDQKYYEVKAGSTVITLKAEYLQTLPAGKYTLLVQYTDGSTDGQDSFTITKHEPVTPSDPSDPSSPEGAGHCHLVIWISIAIVCIVLLILLLLFFKRRKQEKEKNGKEG